MVKKKILICPKCGSKRVGWHMRGRHGHKECKGCGHMKYFKEKEVEEEDELVAP